jgi:hypothetical protein
LRSARTPTTPAARLCSIAVQLALLAGLAGPVAAAPVAPAGLPGAAADTDLMMATQPPDCSGYPQRRVFLEVQAWWRGANTPNGRAHLHAGTCFPLGQKVSGRLRFDIRIIMHNNPGHLFSVSAGVFGGADTYKELDYRCVGTCTYWVTTYVDTRTTLDGWHEFRFKPRVRFRNENRMLTSTGWPAFIANGRRVGDENRDSIGALVARGWYEHHGYQNPVLRSAREAIRGPLSGIWRPAVQLTAGAQGFRPTSVAAYLDADFHHDDPGMVIFRRRGPYAGPLQIDTRELPNGWHRLILRVSASHYRRENSGLLVTWFYVKN